MKRRIARALTLLCAAALAVSVLPSAALAQDVYGEGNVLIAVDMGSFAENEDAVYPDSTLGTLVWGKDAPAGESTRAAFKPRAYAVPEDVTLPPAPD